MESYYKGLWIENEYGQDGELDTDTDIKIKVNDTVVKEVDKFLSLFIWEVK
jgi:hypothetical protein